MRLTYKTDNGEYTGMSNNIEIKTALQKLAILEDIEEELGIDLMELFSKQYESSYLLNIEKDDKTIYFCGDAYYGHWTKEQWLNLIKEVIAVYRELLKLNH